MKEIAYSLWSSKGSVSFYNGRGGKPISNSFNTVANNERHEPFVLPMRYLGMGLFIAWLCCTHLTELYPGLPATPEQRDVITLGMRYGDIGTFIVLALIAPRIHSLSNYVKLSGALVALSSVGTALCAWMLVPAGVSVAILEFAGAITAIGGAILFCMWAQIYCRLTSTQTIVYGAASFILSSVVSFVFAACVQPYSILFISLLPIGSFFCAFVSLRGIPTEPSFAPEVRYPMPWKLIAIMTLAALISVASSALLPNLAGGSIMRNAATGACGLILLVMVLTLHERCDIRLLARIAFPLVLFTVLLMPFAGTELGTFVSFTGKLAYVWFATFVLIVMCGICRRYGVPSLRMFATARCASESALLLGVLFKAEMHEFFYQHNPNFQITFVVLALVALGVSVFIWLREPTVNADWGAAGIVVETGLREENETVRFERRLKELSEEHGLTVRETEIMALIAQGHTRTEICAELFLSENTVKTHARNLYKKLGVHSKSEVPALFS